MFQSADQQAIQNFHRSQKYPKYPKLYKCVALCGQVLLNKISSFYHKELKNFGLLLFAKKTFLTANWKKKYRNVFWLFWLGWPTLCYSCWASMANMACWENICLQNWRFLVVNTPATPPPPLRWHSTSQEGGTDEEKARKLGTQSKNADAMGNDAHPGKREFFEGKRVRRREMRRRLKNAHRRETRKHFRDVRPALMFKEKK